MKRFLSIFAFAAGLILAACTPKEQEIAVTGVKVEPTSVSLEVGETTMLKATVEPADATDKSVTWSSSNVPVAAVQDGTVVAIAPGSATIIVTTVSGGKTATCAVTVKAKGSGEDPNGGEEVKAKGIKLSKSVLTLKSGETSDAIKVTLEPENATDKSFTVVTSDSAVAEVAKTSDSGFTVKGISGGIAEITVTSPDGPTATLVAKVIPAIQEVDLGLPSGVKWASFNIGASSPEDFGCFYAWAETEPKEDYTKGTYKLGEEPFSKYNDTDNKVYLDPEDDAATALYGDGWRTPALAELRELKDKCTWKWTEVNGVKGQTVTGPNGNSIFLPAAGLMNGTDNKFKEIDGVYMVLEKLAGTFNFDSTGAIDRTWDYSIGATVRAVKGNYVKVTSLKLDVTTIENLGPAKAKIRATVQPSNATDKLVEWSTSNKDVATVDQEGNVVILKKGLATISAKCSGFVAGCEIVSAYSWNEPEKVDLGLPSGTLWASFNLGAWQPEEVGAYFAWGETEPKGYFNNSNYKFRNSDKYQLGKTPEVLQPEDDAAHVKFGGKWRIPTNIDWRELIDNCTWTYRSNLNNDASGYGYLVTGPNGKSIILPAGGLYNSKVNGPGDVDYWSSTIAGSVAGWMLTAAYDSQNYLRRDKYQGTPIRPVWADPYPTLTKLELDKHSITAKVGSTVQLTATTSPEQLSAKQLVWKSNFNTFATVDGNGLVTILMEKPAYITVSSAGEAFTDTCEIMPDYKYDQPEEVDLGLPSGLIWASRNLGSSSLWDGGAYFAWGETSPKVEYIKTNYKWGDCDKEDSMTKYNKSDEKTVLDPEDDAAHVLLGGDWRMPTMDELEELHRSCRWSFTKDSSGAFYTGTSYYNDKKIIIPAEGLYYDSYFDFYHELAYLWSANVGVSKLKILNGYPYSLIYAQYYIFRHDYKKEPFDLYDGYPWGSSRYLGASIRPVKSPAPKD